MKKLLLTALAVLTLAGLAHAGTSDITTLADGTCYNIATKQRVDCTTGVVLISDFSSSRDYSVTYSNIISDTTAVGMADSSSVVFTGDCRRWFLNIRASGFVKDVAAVPFVRYAVQVRNHRSGATDSLNTVPWEPTQNSPVSTTAADSLAYGGILLPTSTGSGGLFDNTEFVVTIPMQTAAASKWASPHSYRLALKGNDGTFYEGDWTSIRIRQLGGMGVITTNVDLEGKP